jgi:hypothetical protein
MNLKQSRVPVQLRKDLVAEVRACLKPGMDFNALYGQLLLRLEKAELPSLEQARAWLREPEKLLAARAEQKAVLQQAQERLRAQIVNANISKQTPLRDQLAAETLTFINQFPQLTPSEIKAVTLLRQENGNQDPRVVHLYQIATPDDLADDFADAQPLEGSAGRPGVRYSASCQLFLLKEGEVLHHERRVASPALAEIGD